MFINWCCALDNVGNIEKIAHCPRDTILGQQSGVRRHRGPGAPGSVERGRCPPTGPFKGRKDRCGRPHWRLRHMRSSALQAADITHWPPLRAPRADGSRPSGKWGRFWALWAKNRSHCLTSLSFLRHYSRLDTDPVQATAAPDLSTTRWRFGETGNFVISGKWMKRNRNFRSGSFIASKWSLGDCETMTDNSPALHTISSVPLAFTQCVTRKRYAEYGLTTRAGPKKFAEFAPVSRKCYLGIMRLVGRIFFSFVSVMYLLSQRKPAWAIDGLVTKRDTYELGVTYHP